MADSLVWRTEQRLALLGSLKSLSHTSKKHFGGFNPPSSFCNCILHRSQHGKTVHFSGEAGGVNQRRCCVIRDQEKGRKRGSK